jgi:hypothetical protein
MDHELRNQRDVHKPKTYMREGMNQEPVKRPDMIETTLFEGDKCSVRRKCFT